MIRGRYPGLDLRLRAAGAPADLRRSRLVRPITFAHRGARIEERENTIPAFKRALERGARGLESDAWLSADGEVVLVHGDVSWHGLRRVRVGRTDADVLARYGVPRLADLYDECGADFELSIDVKTPAAARPTVEVAAAAGASERLWLCTGRVPLLASLRGDRVPCKLVHSRRKRALDAPLERHAADLAALGVDAMNMHHTDWSTGVVALFHRFDVAAFAWDVQEVRHLRAVLRMGVDGLYCDHVDRMVATVAEWTG
jgi:glycerophosphoryl diester phosphodiesterase